jgi:hypothetical protein
MLVVGGGAGAGGTPCAVAREHLLDVPVAAARFDRAADFRRQHAVSQPGPHPR